jgi:hypothetical protein
MSFPDLFIYFKLYRDSAGGLSGSLPYFKIKYKIMPLYIKISFAITKKILFRTTGEGHVFWLNMVIS